LALAVCGGFFGLHRFYAGRARSAVGMCLTLGGLGLWYLYDVVVIAAGDFRDGNGRRIERWEVAEEGGGGAGGADNGLPHSARRVEQFEDRLQALESQVYELAERLDFAERLLAQARERGTLPKG
jgi:TM2 domain-containing protein